MIEAHTYLYTIQQVVCCVAVYQPTHMCSTEASDALLPRRPAAWYSSQGPSKGRPLYRRLCRKLLRIDWPFSVPTAYDELLPTGALSFNYDIWLVGITVTIYL